jgi:hypothetical protein
LASEAETEYIRAAEVFGIETDLAGKRGFSARRQNQAHDDVISAAKRVIEQSDNYADFFESLLANNNSSVQVWASLHLLHFRPRPALKSLKRLASSDSHNSFSAQMTISEWRKGRLNPLWFMTDPMVDDRPSWSEYFKRNFHYFTAF